MVICCAKYMQQINTQYGENATFVVTTLAVLGFKELFNMSHPDVL
jgi:hypothetical protein